MGKSWITEDYELQGSKLELWWILEMGKSWITEDYE
jgi:hypothetical protein